MFTTFYISSRYPHVLARCVFNVAIADDSASCLLSNFSTSTLPSNKKALICSLAIFLTLKRVIGRQHYMVQLRYEFQTSQNTKITMFVTVITQ